MSRPTDWYVVDLGGDPTPGDAWGVRSLAREYGEIATSARTASTVLTRVQSSGSSAVWVGEAAEVFRDKLEDFPGNIAKCATSFEMVRDAVSSWATSVESWQSQADTNLNKARLARADIEAAQAALVAAQDAAASVQSELDRAMRTVNQYQYIEPPANIKVPTAYQLSQLRSRATGATGSTTSASTTVQEAQDRFDAAKALVLAAAEEFAAAAKTVVGMIEAAKDAGVEADSWWEKIYHSDAWQVMVTIVTVVVIVAALAAFFVTGPLALIISAVAIAGNVILNAQDIMSFVAGDMSTAELAIMLALALVPGGRAMRSLNKATDAAVAAKVATKRTADGTTTVAARRLDDASIPAGARNSREPGAGLDALAQKKIAMYDKLINQPGMPEHLRRMFRGSQFNWENYHRFDYREVLVEVGTPPKRVRVDSYTPNQWIVSRKYSQLGGVREKTAMSYIDEMVRKYNPGLEDVRVVRTDANVAQFGSKSGDIVGEGLSGQMVLEVPVQGGSIPPGVLQHAKEQGVEIRDINGFLYNP